MANEAEINIEFSDAAGEHCKRAREYIQNRLHKPGGCSCTVQPDGQLTICREVDTERDTPAERAHQHWIDLMALPVDDEFMQAFAAPGTISSLLVHNSDLLLGAFQRLGIISAVHPVHNLRQVRAVWSACTGFAAPTDAILSYFGSHVSMYFAWLNFYTAWLVAPAAVGVAVSAAHFLHGRTIEDSPYQPAYSVFVLLWAAAFLKAWSRRSKQLAWDWGTFEAGAATEVNPFFRGVLRLSPVTEQLERHYPPHRRLPWYCLSVVTTLTLMAGVFCIMICSLNLQGYVHEAGMFHIPVLSAFSRPGAVFDPSGLFWIVPTLIHVCTIYVLNQLIFRRIASLLTHWENHATAAAAESSLIAKRVLFEAFDCYIALFYLAFWEWDIAKLRGELCALFAADCIRRLALETVLPKLLSRFTKVRKTRQVREDKQLGNGKGPDLRQIDHAARCEYEQFDDYLEMVIGWGYVTMFAGAFPLAAALSLVYQLIESKSDIYKLTSAYKRPPPQRANSIGAWQVVLTVQTWMAVSTNVMLFALSSGQMSQYFPSLFVYVPDETLYGTEGMESTAVLGSGRTVIGLAWAMERILMLMVLLITVCIPDTPSSLQTAIDRRRHMLRKQGRQPADGPRRATAH